jgi:PleD family two-component response regulator
LFRLDLRYEFGDAYRIGGLQDRKILCAMRHAVGAEIRAKRRSMKKHWPILVVDDEEVMCESMAAWLREDGYRVDTAPDGQKALELARAADYAICFVDL